MAWSTDFETGLLDDYDFTIESAVFETDPKYMNGTRLLLKWDGITNSQEVPYTHIWIPIGKGFETRDGGRTIQHESGDPKRYFQNTSLIARIITRCVKDFDMGEALDQRAAELGIDDAEGSWRYARMWETMKFHINRQTLDYGGDIDPQKREMPTAFLGLVAPGAERTEVTTSGADAAAQIAAAKARSNGNGGGNALRAAAIKALQENDFNPDAALNVPGVSNDDALLGEILDTNSGLWAEAKA